jgi:hypothetical protein
MKRIRIAHGHCSSLHSNSFFDFNRRQGVYEGTTQYYVTDIWLCFNLVAVSVTDLWLCKQHSTVRHSIPFHFVTVAYEPFFSIPCQRNYWNF